MALPAPDLSPGDQALITMQPDDKGLPRFATVIRTTR